MIELLPQWFLELGPISQAFLAGLFTWGLTALGASVVFLTKNVSQTVLDSMLGFAAGVMIAASVWSLIIPSIEMTEAMGGIGWLPAATGFLVGGLFLRVCDAFLPHLHIGSPTSDAEGVKTSWRRSTLLVLAITLHNIPEGLAVGVLFGAAATGVDPTGTATIAGAVTLAVGIGIQNLPEGTAVSVPLRREGVKVGKSFYYGQLSGMVEPIFAVVGALSVIYVQPILPFALAFAAGAMIYVVVEELIPESQMQGNADIATLGTMIGFVIMMTLDVALG